MSWNNETDYILDIDLIQSITIRVILYTYNTEDTKQK